MVRLNRLTRWISNPVNRRTMARSAALKSSLSISPLLEGDARREVLAQLKERLTADFSSLTPHEAVAVLDLHRKEHWLSESDVHDICLRCTIYRFAMTLSLLTRLLSLVASLGFHNQALSEEWLHKIGGVQSENINSAEVVRVIACAVYLHRHPSPSIALPRGQLQSVIAQLLLEATFWQRCTGREFAVALRTLESVMDPVAILARNTAGSELQSCHATNEQFTAAFVRSYLDWGTAVSPQVLNALSPSLAVPQGEYHSELAAINDIRNNLRDPQLWTSALRESSLCCVRCDALPASKPLRRCLALILAVFVEREAPRLTMGEWEVIVEIVDRLKQPHSVCPVIAESRIVMVAGYCTYCWGAKAAG